MEAQSEPTWPELLGSGNWQNLLNPLNLSLRHLILRCGDFCQVTYDSFNNDKNSKYCGTSRYGKRNIFDKVMLEEADKFQVAAFLYGTARISLPEAFILHSQSRDSWDRESNWIGYIAVTNDEYSKVIGRRDIYIAFRGTTRNYEWANVIAAKLQSAKALLKQTDDDDDQKLKDSTTSSHCRIKEFFARFAHDSSSSDKDEDEDDDEVPKVMQGWITIYTSDNPKSPFTKFSMRNQLLSKINELKEKYKDENLSIIFTGHSLGASLSILAAFDLVENGIISDKTPVSAIVFGSPQVGNKAFTERFNKFPNLNVLHVKNKIDVLVHYPGKLLGFEYIGTELEIGTRSSPSLKESNNPSDWHNLQAILHVVAGWNGEDGEFELKVKRSLALVNKSCEFLKDEYLVPGSWWVEKNKGLVRGDDGEWSHASPDEEDLPVPEID